MRSIMGITASAIALAIVGAAPASASTWACQGPGYACNDRTSSASGYRMSSSKAAYKSQNRAAYNAKSSRQRVATKTYSSGGSGSSGKASYYWQPQRVASGGWFNPNAMTAAHKTLPFGTKVRVTNKNNGKSVVVTINDRGPYIAGRIIDLSRAAAQSISMTGYGVAPVSVTVLGRG